MIALPDRAKLYLTSREWFRGMIYGMALYLLSIIIMKLWVLSIAERGQDRHSSANEAIVLWGVIRKMHCFLLKWHYQQQEMKMKEYCVQIVSKWCIRPHNVYLVYFKLKYKSDYREHHSTITQSSEIFTAGEHCYWTWSPLVVHYFKLPWEQLTVRQIELLRGS